MSSNIQISSELQTVLQYDEDNKSQKGLPLETKNRKNHENRNLGFIESLHMQNKGKRKVQGVPQSQTAALPRHQEEEEMDKTKHAQIKQGTKSTL